MNTTQKVALLFSSPAEVQQLANLAHQVSGILLIITAFLILLSYNKKLQASLQRGYATLLIVTSLLFTSYILVSKGIQNLKLLIEVILSFPEIAVHLSQIVIIIVGCVGELYLIGKMRMHQSLQLIFPGAFILLGMTNILHPRGSFHDEHTMYIHALLGCLQILFGLFLIVGRLLPSSFEKFFFQKLAVLFLFLAGVVLISYKEPPFAYVYAFPLEETATIAIDLSDKAVIYLSKNGAYPNNIKIKENGRVTFIELDNSLHDIASGPHPTHRDFPPLNIGILYFNEAKSVIFPNKGTFGFHDHLNDLDQNFYGRIQVY